MRERERISSPSPPSNSLLSLLLLLLTDISQWKLGKEKKKKVLPTIRLPPICHVLRDKKRPAGALSGRRAHSYKFCQRNIRRSRATTTAGSEFKQFQLSSSCLFGGGGTDLPCHSYASGGHAIKAKIEPNEAREKKRRSFKKADSTQAREKRKLL